MLIHQLSPLIMKRNLLLLKALSVSRWAHIYALAHFGL